MAVQTRDGGQHFGSETVSDNLPRRVGFRGDFRMEAS